MKIAVTIIFLITCVVLQLALREVGFYISLMSLALCYLCLLLAERKIEEVLWLALGVGILLDLFSGTPDGVMAISVPAGVKLAEYIGGTFFSERLNYLLIPSYIFAATVGYVVSGLLVLWGLSLLGWVYTPDNAYYLTWLLPISLIFNMLGLVPAYFIKNLEDFVQKKYIPKNESI